MALSVAPAQRPASAKVSYQPFVLDMDSKGLFAVEILDLASLKSRQSGDFASVRPPFPPKACISLDSFGRIRAFQWVTANPNKYFLSFCPRRGAIRSQVSGRIPRLGKASMNSVFRK
jgi:hypothetical protein